jgi:hypothetical protein
VRVLIINSLGRENSPYEVFASAFRSELVRRITTPVAFHETSLDGARFDPARDSASFVRHLQERHAQSPPIWSCRSARWPRAFARRTARSCFPPACRCLWRWTRRAS